MPLPLFIIFFTLAVAPPKVYEMRVTGYYAPPGAVGALTEPVRPGGTAAVSPKCIGLLGEKVYVKGNGVFEVNDLTADWLDERHSMCTLDIAAPSVEQAKAIGNETKTVVRIK